MIAFKTAERKSDPEYWAGICFQASTNAATANGSLMAAVRMSMARSSWRMTLVERKSTMSHGIIRDATGTAATASCTRNGAFSTTPR